MKRLAQWLVLASLVMLIAVFVTTLPAFAQGPAPVGKTANDPVTNLKCDWIPIDPAPQPGYFTDVFYKVPYAKGTTLTIFANTTTTQGFGFDVYTPEQAALYYVPYDNIEFSQYSAATVDGSGTKPNAFGLGDLQWSGKMYDGSNDGWMLLNVWNTNTTPVWYNLCSTAK